MDRELTPDELDELLAAYALDAVDDDERAAIEAYLLESPRARDEVAGYREVAAYLHEESGPAPAGVWDRIAASLEERPPPLRLEVARARTARFTSPRALAVAAAIVVIAAIGGVLAGRASRDDTTTTLAAEYHRAQNDPDRRDVRLVSADSKLALPAVVEPDGAGWLDASTLPALAPQSTYQMWAVRGDNAVSLGVLGANPSIVAFRLDAPTDAIAITTENAGGVVKTANTPLVVAAL
jgi:anti-sigma factor RsiW